MIFRPITLDDKPLFDYYLACAQHQLITYCFASLYIWRNWDRLSWAETPGALVVKSDLPGEEMFLLPCGESEESTLLATETLISYCAEQGRRFCLGEATAADIALYENRWPGRLRSCEYRPGANYIYTRRDLAELPGPRYHAKRNHIRRFMRLYPDHSFLPLCPELIPGCQEQLRHWNSQKNSGNSELCQEYPAVLDALAHWRQLDCQAAVLVVGKRVAAFTIGSPLNDDTYCVHIEKADANIHGAYQMINYCFAREYSRGYSYINRAEDMGRPGLARAKLSYYPCRLEKNFCLFLP
ncbi:MAG: DUF2156 domain-containing protein [Clostridia bacterium]|nr:DUF2156 domain-containing protein [Clostridia bacterium]